ncbi:hypothetical protein SODALDRAFT_321882 [Sodiomyces alkalinus F11]|uniref:Rab-GAP TBC domain-containing protein n=1 Tax=Sodiomyces alkalinus (strain CBS 110278 / VKM F-3762 / F11) TaxID=1314773 RepID=A0A3N2Q1B8_SODAK|nr:hypothetical protein SODALDRAFT_321882 [Sodiomyces alkalinus F11]ROT40554.1 hypothetical protein SODALDRAFT_321882 [Sodiomyces alkalinus F11]
METEPGRRVPDDSPVEAMHTNTSPLHEQSPTRDSDETSKITHDSMVTVRLSEPPSLTVDTTFADANVSTPQRPNTVRLDKTPLSTPLSEVAGGESGYSDVHCQEEEDSVGLSTPLSVPNGIRSIEDELSESEERDREEAKQQEEQQTEESEEGNRRSSVSEEVNWEQLQKSEAEEPKDEDTDRSTAMLLAMLEKENAKLATNPKSVKVRAAEPSVSSSSPRPRPPSMAQLRQMVNGPTPPALRYSMLPPPPMTDLEFYAALVKDYQQTAARLPTLLSNKIRKGIPPPLRGVVWQSMAGARDAALEEQYETLSGESSPYEPIIGKDLGRSFPGVDMFRDPEGDGQRMLGKVLKCFSLYDQKIGYCQGLAFLVGPLLMHMPDKQAFCVLVRLMERYDLTSCFLPDLSGLHIRIYQFRELLHELLPSLARHLEDLQVDPAYVSQWFLSFFAVTCPLPMLFRIYDVIFAEGAPETLMRVALSLMRKNEARILACSELEDVMQLLLSRGLWDCYHYNADEFVQDFVSLTGVVSREKLLQLEQGCREAQIATANAARTSDVATAASRFLGRIWAVSPPKPSSLSPGLYAPSRPLSMLRRSTSKQSLASTLNSMEASSASVASSASTEATAASRDSSTTTADDTVSTRQANPTSTLKNTEERNLHSQIEDLLTALSELQRNHALLVSELQKEREEREEDRQAVRSLLEGLRKRASNDSVGTEASAETVKVKATELEEPSAPPIKSESESGSDSGSDRSVDQAKKRSGAQKKGEKPKEQREGGEPEEKSIHDDDDDEADDVNTTPSAQELSQLLDVVEQRFGSVGAVDTARRRSSTIRSKSQLQEELSRAKDQLASAVSQSQEYGRSICDMSQEISSLKDQLKESHAHARNMHQDKQRLERQIHSMRTRTSSASSRAETNNNRTAGSEWPRAAAPANGGLRELKLGRSKSTPAHTPAASFSKRTSSLPQPHLQETMAPGPVTAATTTAPPPPAPPGIDHDVLLLELVQAKTAEAIAKQEAEEAKQKLESLKKAYGLGPGDSSLLPVPTQGAAANPAQAVSAAVGVFNRLTGGGGVDATKTTAGAAPALARTASSTAVAAPATASAGGFWAWRRT